MDRSGYFLNFKYRTLSGKGLGYLCRGGGMFRSTDDGATWTVIQDGLGYGQTTVTGLTLVGTKLFASTLAGVVRSTDGGNSWSTVTGTGDINDATSSIAAHDSTILVGWAGGIIRSTDGGNTWIWPGTDGPSYSGLVWSIVMDSTYSYIGTQNGVLLSTDRGVTWDSVGNGLPLNKVLSLAVADTDLYATSFNNGVYASTDNGKNWTYAANGIVGSDVTSVSGDGSNVYAVFNGDSLYSSTDNGNTWLTDTTLKVPGEINAVTVIGTTVYVVTGGGTYASSDSGKTWNTLDLHAQALVQSGANLIAAKSQLYYSTDFGKNWSLAEGSPMGVGELTASGTNVVAVGDSGIYRSSDSGKSWTKVNGDLIDVSSIAESGSTVVAGRWVMPYPVSDTVPPPPGGLFLSTDYGETWSSYSNGLPGFGSPQVLAVAIQGQDVFAGLTDQGAIGFYPSMFYSSTVNRDSWKNTGQGLPYLGISSIYLNNSSVFVGIGQEGGLWRAPLSQVTGVNFSGSSLTPSSLKLSQNYPNPFNPSTTIDYSVPKRSHVTLIVFNIIGQKVKTLVDTYQGRGNYSVIFDASNLASGVYLYRLTVGLSSISKKLMLLK